MGHGSFTVYLNKFELKNSSTSLCGLNEEMIQHLPFERLRQNRDNYNLEAVIDTKLAETSYSELIANNPQQTTLDTVLSGGSQMFKIEAGDGPRTNRFFETIDG